MLFTSPLTADWCNVSSSRGTFSFLWLAKWFLFSNRSYILNMECFSIVTLVTSTLSLSHWWIGHKHYKPFVIILLYTRDIQYVSLSVTVYETSGMREYRYTNISVMALDFSLWDSDRFALWWYPANKADRFMKAISMCHNICTCTFRELINSLNMNGIPTFKWYTGLLMLTVAGDKLFCPFVLYLYNTVLPT